MASCLTFSADWNMSATSRMLQQYVHQFSQKLAHRRPLEAREESESQPISTLDLVALGVGRTLGAGRVHVLVGAVAGVSWTSDCHLLPGDEACPVCLSGLCYAEFGARSIQFCVSLQLHYHGTTLSAITGWNLILSLVIGERMDWRRYGA